MQIAFCASALSVRTLSHLRPLSRLLSRPRYGQKYFILPRPLLIQPHIFRACASTPPPSAALDLLPPVPIHNFPPDAIDTLRAHFAALSNGDRAALEQLLINCFPFSLDAFQVSALRALVQGESVVLSAPTGAGKTIVGEMAVYLALCKGLRVFYTTPLKALSNQKFYDFKRQFGDSRVGLLTGDVTVNRDAQVVVMTTEVYRNMLYAESAEGDSTTTDNLLAVVFDEFHYLNDRSRGTVWEESVINSPPHVLLVALSATMSNTADVRDWFRGVQGPTTLIQSLIRPVPLKFAYCDQEGMTPLFANSRADRSSQQRKRGFGKRRKVNNEEKPESELKLHPKLLRRLKESGVQLQRKGQRRRSAASLDENDSIEFMKIKYQEIATRAGIRGRGKYSGIPSFPYVVRNLRRSGMLPCIMFIFSRAGCDRAAVSAAAERESLVTEAEREKIKERLDAFVADHPDLVQPERLGLALQGIASHHAGLLPLWKVCVEEMFQDGLIKVVFATETLAAGINMPARTTVISALSKRAGEEEGFVNLTTSEVLQMAGRAGRRGKDVVGHSIILRSKKEGALEAFKVVTAEVDELQSKFTPNYGMVLNLLAARPLSEAKKLVDRSFGNFLWQKRMKEQTQRGDKKSITDEDTETIVREKVALEQVLEEAKRVLEEVDQKRLRAYIKSIERVKAERRALSYLVQQSTETDTEFIEETLTFAPTGTRLLLKQKASKPSNGSERRQKRREYSAALAAAGEGDLGAELKEFYLGFVDTELENIDNEEEEEGENVIEAVLLDMHNDSAGVLPMFAAVDANGDLRLFNHMAVSRLFFDVDTVAVEDMVKEWSQLRLPERSLWHSLGGDQYIATLPSELECLVGPVRQWRDDRNTDRSNMPLESGSTQGDQGNIAHPEVEAQRERVKFAKQKVREHELHGRENVNVILSAKRAIPRIEATLSGEMDPWGTKRRKGMKKTNRYAEVSVDGAGEDEGKFEAGTMMVNSSWEEFMAIASVLQHYGFLDDSYHVTSLGSVGAKVRSDNELWTSITLLQPELEKVSPVQLGAIVGATQLEGSRGDVYMEYEASQETMRVISIMQAERARLLGIQGECGVDMVAMLDTELVGLVERWATGVSWVELLSGTSMQEGDACRLLRRVLDLLRQIQHLPVVSGELKRNAKRAVCLLDRFPVTDDQTYVVRENERLEGGEEG